MKKILVYTLVGMLFLSLSAFTFHKFYMGIFQINYVTEKKMLQITSRIFVDDLNKAIEKKYNKKTFLGTNKETATDLDLLKKYLSESFVIKINGQNKPIIFLSKELEADDVLVCYSKITTIEKLKTIEIFNSVLIDWNPEQQNIMHISAFGIKKSVLFTDSSKKELLNY